MWGVSVFVVGAGRGGGGEVIGMRFVECLCHLMVTELLCPSGFLSPF